MKRQEGVTLIALAVTIIVMLILAGVSISTLQEIVAFLKMQKMPDYRMNLEV